MNILIKQFKKHAKELGRNTHSMSEFKLWIMAVKTVEFDKIFEENKGFTTEGAYDIIKILREKYHLSDLDIESFIQDYIVNPKKEVEGTYELDRTEGRPGESYEEFREDLVGLG